MPMASSEVESTFVPTVRRLQWPNVAFVDIASEFPWLILHDTTDHEYATRQREELEVRESIEKTSVYAQPLRASPNPPAALSPAQRAARKILKLQDELERQEEYTRRREACAKAAAVESPLCIKSEDLRPLPERRAVMSTTKQKKPVRSIEATSPHAKLKQWLARHPSQSDATNDPPMYSNEMKMRLYTKMHATLGAGLWADEVASPIAAELSSESVFGGLVPTRRLAFVPPQPLVVTQTNETMARVGVTTNSNSTFPLLPASAIEECIPERTPTSDHVDESPPTAPLDLLSSPRFESSLVEQFAYDVRAEANALVTAGDVTEALAVLQVGIHRVLHEFQDNQDELRQYGFDGFDYSLLAHSMAKRVQRVYKIRHYQRIANLVRLQRGWRRSRSRRRYQEKQTWRVTHATVIQRVYKKRYIRRLRERSAVRLQRFFRVYLSQRLLIWLHRACRVLTTDYRRQREILKAKRRQRRRLWTRLMAILTMMRLVWLRRRAIVCIQSHWRGYRIRHQYTQTLAFVITQEIHRREREDAFVTGRLARAREALRVFYAKTISGQRLVTWRLRAPWLRWRRLRSQLNRRKTQSRGISVTTLRALYAQRDGTEDVVLRGLDARAVCSLLGEPLQPLLRLGAVASRSTSETQPEIHPHHRWVPMWTRRWATRRMRSSTLWTLVGYPKLVLETSNLFHARCHRAQETAILDLLEQHERVLRVHLRRLFRATENDPPKFECLWCGEGIATAREYFAHRSVASGCATHERNAHQERMDLAADVTYHQRPRYLFRRRQNRSPAPVAAPTTFTADIAFVQRVAKRGRWNLNRNSGHKALQCLVDVAKQCGPIGINALPSMPTELLAQLVWLLDDTSGTPLERIHAVTHCDISKSTGWITVEEAENALGLRPQRTQRTKVLTRAWQQLRAQWTMRRGNSRSRYRLQGHGDSGASNPLLHWWHQRMLARVVAVG